MIKFELTELSLDEAEKLYDVGGWTPYDTDGPVIEKWHLVPPDLRQEAVYILEGKVTVRTLDVELHLEPGHLLVLDDGAEFTWIVEDYVRSVYKEGQWL